jgi:hypothetical protein
MCYNSSVKSAASFRLPAVALAIDDPDPDGKEGAPPAMLARHAVLLTHPKSFHLSPITSSPTQRPRKSFGSNTYGSPASAANKRLTEKLNPLNATLTKNTGVTSFNQEPLSFLAPRSRRLLHFHLAPLLSSVCSSKFRILQPLWLSLLRKLPGCVPTIPILELCTKHSPLSTPYPLSVRSHHPLYHSTP